MAENDRRFAGDVAGGVSLRQNPRMTMLGTISAWAAFAMAAMFAVNTYFQFATGVSGWICAATALGLAAGGVRTLRRMSGGLRLLAGAWGFASAQLMAPFLAARPEGAALDVGGLLLAGMALAGLALTVLHKEKK